MKNVHFHIFNVRKKPLINRSLVRKYVLPFCCKRIIIIIIITSSWLTAVSLVDQDLVLNKQEFRDSLRLRCNMPLSDLPSKCVCGEKYTVCHALSCKKGGFVAQRHDGVRNLLTSLIGKVCTNVEVEPQLQPLDNERFNLRTAVTSPKARLHFKALFWSRGVTAYFDVRVSAIREKQHPQSLRSRRRRKSESTNRGCWTLKWDLLLP